MKKNFKFLVLIAMIATTAMAQVQFDKVKIPADTRLYLQLLENGDKQVRARSMDAKATQPEAQLFVSCDADADTKAIEAQLKAVGAKPQGTIGRYIMVSTPVSVVNKIADIEGVTYISKGPSVSLKTLSSTTASTSSILRSRTLRATSASRRSTYQVFRVVKATRR